MLVIVCIHIVLNLKYRRVFVVKVVNVIRIVIVVVKIVGYLIVVNLELITAGLVLRDIVPIDDMGDLDGLLPHAPKCSVGVIQLLNK